MHENGRGQTKASDREVEDIVQLFLQRLRPSYLVFDGLDECLDAEGFLESLVQLTHKTRCKLVLLARPTVDVIGTIGQRNVCHIVLKKDGNSKDIESYLEVHMSRLAKRGAFPIDLELTHIIAQLSRRSNSMFLWARLMSNYLSSPYLTPNERSDAIHHLNRFEGLDTMYAKILEELARRVPERQHQKIYNIFQWLVVAQRFLSIEDLRTALAVQRHRQATSNDFIQDFENILPQLCGSLVEIHADGTIGFIHLSTLEYLTQPSKVFLGAQEHFQIERSLSQASMADLCLSYMMQEVPEGPLTPSSKLTTQRIEVGSRLPLLNYTSEYWTWHTAQTFLLLHESDASQLLSSLSSAINALIHNKRLITTWIEASFLFGKIPNLTILVSSHAKYYESLSTLRERPSHLGDALGRLCVEIENIYLKWYKVLSEQPNKIWGPSISAWSRWEFLVHEDRARIHVLNSHKEQGWILLASHVSSDGKEEGAIKVLPQRRSILSSSWALHHAPHIGDTTETSNSDWMAVYEVWSLETLQIISRVEFSLPQQVKQSGDNFHLPVAFSQDLRIITVADTVLVVRLDASGKKTDKADLQVLTPSGCQHTGRKQGQWHISTFKDVRGTPSSGTKSHSRHTQIRNRSDGLYEYIFSPSGIYLAALDGDNVGISNSWVLTFLEYCHIPPSKPCFSRIASIRIEFSPVIIMGHMSNTIKQELMCFHPVDPVAAFCAGSQVVLWQFIVKGNSLLISPSKRALIT